MGKSNLEQLQDKLKDNYDESYIRMLVVGLSDIMGENTETTAKSLLKHINDFGAYKEEK